MFVFLHTFSLFHINVVVDLHFKSKFSFETLHGNRRNVFVFVFFSCICFAGRQVSNMEKLEEKEKAMTLICFAASSFPKRVLIFLFQ